MAGDWIKMRTNLDSDVRIIELAALLGLAELHVVGCLWKLWAWADTHTHDGNAIRVTGVTLDRFTGIDGFADALRKVGWLEGRDNALTFPRFAEHNGQTAKKRAETNQRVAKHRNAKGVTDVTQKALPEKRREEKRRKEIEEGESDKSDPPADKVSVGELVLEEWNRQMSQTCRWTKKRQVAFRERWKSQAWQSSWKQAVERAAASRFCRGENDRGWLADFEWFLKPDTVTKLLEGKYDDRERKQTGKTFAQQSQSNIAAILAKAAADDAAAGRPVVSGFLEVANGK